MIEKRKVVLVGTGFVGMSMAYSLLNQGGINELVLIDVLKDKAVGEAMDLSHGVPCAPAKIDIKAGDYDECKDADIVVITAGLAQKPGQTRLDLAKTNAKIMKDITQSVVSSGFNGIFVIASNPVDLMTYVVQKVSGFPKSKVIGSGTVLDTARLRYLLGEHLEVSSKNVHAYIMGEHGDSSFVPWSHSYIGCKSLINIIKQRNEDLKILKLSFIVMLCLVVISLGFAFFIDFWQYTWALSIFIGYISAVISYIKLVYVVTNVTNFIYQNPKKVFILNNLSSLFIYFIVLLISVLVPIFNIYLCFLGIVIIKIVIIILYGRKPKAKEDE